MRVIVATGRTEEPVTRRGTVLTNGFTGLQGQEIARAFLARGAEVTVVSGPTALPDVAGVRTLHVRTAAEMARAVLEALEEGTDVYVSAAAIADFTLGDPAAPPPPGVEVVLPFIETPSLLAAVAAHAKRPRVVVGFAAQSPEALEAYALEKFRKSGADLTVANAIGPGTPLGLDPGRNRVAFVTGGGIEWFPEGTKAEVAERIVEKVLGYSCASFNFGA